MFLSHRSRSRVVRVVRGVGGRAPSARPRRRRGRPAFRVLLASAHHPPGAIETYVVLIVLLVALAVLAVAAERWLRDRAVQRAADRLANELQAEVELHVVGRPMLRNVLRRRVSSLTVVVHELPISGGQATVRRVTVELLDVHVRGTGDARVARATAGSFAITMHASELNRVVSLPNYLVSFDVTPRGLRLQTMAGVFVDATIRLETASLLVRPTGSVLRLLPQPSFRLPLPPLPWGGRVERFTLHAGWFEASGHLDPARLEIPVQLRGWDRTTRPRTEPST